MEEYSGINLDNMVSEISSQSFNEQALKSNFASIVNMLKQHQLKLNQLSSMGSNNDKTTQNLHDQNENMKNALEIVQKQNSSLFEQMSEISRDQGKIREMQREWKEKNKNFSVSIEVLNEGQENQRNEFYEMNQKFAQLKSDSEMVRTQMRENKDKLFYANEKVKLQLDSYRNDQTNSRKILQEFRIELEIYKQFTGKLETISNTHTKEIKEQKITVEKIENTMEAFSWKVQQAINKLDALQKKFNDRIKNEEIAEQTVNKVQEKQINFEQIKAQQQKEIDHLRNLLSDFNLKFGEDSKIVKSLKSQLQGFLTNAFPDHVEKTKGRIEELFEKYDDLFENQFKDIYSQLSLQENFVTKQMMKGKIKQISENAADKNLTKKALMYLEGLVVDMFNLKADKNYTFPVAPFTKSSIL